MYHTPLLNPGQNEVLGRIRQTNTRVIAGKGFPFWPKSETIDISLIDAQPSVLDVLQAMPPHFTVGAAWMAEELKEHNDPTALQRLEAVLRDAPMTFLPHTEFKYLAPKAIDLIRTRGTAPCSNIILESA